MAQFAKQAERRMYILRDQLKIQYRATQKAQINERKASESKRRLTSCVSPPSFHGHAGSADERTAGADTCSTRCACR